MENELTVIGERSISEVSSQVQKIQDLMRTIMKKGEHYGEIPGCGNKPTLLKPGAEKICFVFRLIPTFQITMRDLPNAHREYEVTCTLEHEGRVVGQGLGCCSTMESKYRFRSENTQKPVPAEYWNNRDTSLLGGPTFKTKKIDGKWYIFQQVEYDNPADYYNTCLKISKKRAFVDGVITVTAAGDIMTQDLEDLQDNGILPEVETKQAPMQKAPQRQGEASGQTTNLKSAYCKLEKEDVKTRDMLKQKGFKWNPEKFIWEKMVTEEELKDLLEIVDIKVK
jgi:hypothetical protein